MYNGLTVAIQQCDGLILGLLYLRLVLMADPSQWYMDPSGSSALCLETPFSIPVKTYRKISVDI
jgi:hypothetical protein